MAKDKILFDTRKEKITPEKFEELWAMCKKEDEKRNEEWDKLSKEEQKELESELNVKIHPQINLASIIKKETNTDFFNLTITPNKQLQTGDKVIVEIEATSNTGYKKTIKGKFVLVVGQEKLTYQITDAKEKPYMNLRIW